MAIRFFPSTEDTDAQYEMLNRLLRELCELLRVMMVTRGAETTAQIPSNLQLPDLLAHNNVHQQLPRRRVRSSQTPPTSPSCSFQHLSRTFSEVFDPEPTNSMAYFGDDEVFCPNTPAITPSTATNRPTFPPRQRRRRRRTTSLREIRKKTTKSKGEDAANWNGEETTCLNRDDSCETNANVEVVPQAPIVLGNEGSLISTFLSASLGGSIWTAVVLVVGWKLLATTR
ncbi:uncharacterized protein LOC143912179 [Arctopsyche grandis]|uniref:uncharacterized protein LOC143912179 n=1 Tax=Arctopsyche grandis TaxID=121162 RepID=UPI00406D9944